MEMDNVQIIGVITAVLVIVFQIAIITVFLYLLALAIKALRRYLRTKEVRKEKQIICKSLGELLKENRIRCKMTQEFVAEAVGVSRQAVSKWENGTADPSTSNLMTLANLYGIAAGELLKSVGSDTEKKGKKEDTEVK